MWTTVGHQLLKACVVKLAGARVAKNPAAGVHGFKRVPAVARMLMPAALAVAAVLGSLSLVRGAELEAGKKAFLSGRYETAETLAREGVTEGIDRQEWQLLLCRALLARGEYPAALEAVTNALRLNAWSIRLQWQAREVFLANGQPERAAGMVQDILQTVAGQPRGYRDAASMVAFGQAALAAGADPKRVLDTVFDAARRADPALRDTYQACGNLALEKHDYSLAARQFEEGLKKLPDDPDLLYGRARAFAPSDTEMMLESVHATLEKNSNHVGCLLLLVDRVIDAEDYAGAEALLDRVERVNPWHTRAWACRAVIAHFRNQPAEEKAARENALKFWPGNPEADHLIGAKLSQHYRFAEGAACQRRALALNPDYLPAKAQLSRDLLRLGEDEEGWKLADEVHKQDGYDTEAYNLVTLRDVLGGYHVVTNEHFIVRMTPREADLYGLRALEVLEAARISLATKYGLELTSGSPHQPNSRVVVEIFAEQKDFAVRTFGMPGNPGYLGVCFGNVITANSPAAHPGTPVNWEAVLWHEFCHVVTLRLTRNKMPRWLSEGISVYEELRANPAWGQRMNPQYREMILEGELTPVSRLSGAFMAPPTPMHLQFAYFEASMMVDYIVNRFGLGRLTAILRDLGEGVEINRALETHTAPMARLEQEFEAFARKQAEELASGLDWARPGQPGSALARIGPRGARKDTGREPEPGGWSDASISPEEWLRDHPKSFYALSGLAQNLIAEDRFEEAKAPLQVILEHYPAQRGPACAAALLAQVHRRLNETNAERAVLSHWVRQDGEALAGCLRLIELDHAAGDWRAVLENSARCLAINPLAAAPYRHLAHAAEQTGANGDAIRAYRAQLRLDPLDPADTHFKLARALHREGDPAARRHVLEALEEAPRHRSALDLLLRMNRPGETSREAREQPVAASGLAPSGLPPAP